MEMSPKIKEHYSTRESPKNGCIIMPTGLHYHRWKSAKYGRNAN